jgi:hypothetical protein
MGTHLAQPTKKYTFRRLLRTETPKAATRPGRQEREAAVQGR